MGVRDTTAQHILFLNELVITASAVRIDIRILGAQVARSRSSRARRSRALSLCFAALLLALLFALLCEALLSLSLTFWFGPEKGAFGYLENVRVFDHLSQMRPLARRQSTVAGQLQPMHVGLRDATQQAAEPYQ